jgi:GTP-binding protein YchF
VTLRAGIVGLPNVGKSTLFNAVTRTRNAEAANYPFCTIDPNVGMVSVPESRLEPLCQIAKTTVVIPAAIEFVDIAGLVKGASQGEGLGNKFLTHVREVDAIVQVVRCFEDADVHHVSGGIDPVRDIEVINTELALADLDSVRKRRERAAKDIKRGDKAAAAEEAVRARIEAVLDQGKPALVLVGVDDFERGFIKAETVAYDDLIRCGSVAAARDKGLYRMEGKDYVVAGGDVMLFKFNV